MHWRNKKSMGLLPSLTIINSSSREKFLLLIYFPFQSSVGIGDYMIFILPCTKNSPSQALLQCTFPCIISNPHRLEEGRAGGGGEKEGGRKGKGGKEEKRKRSQDTTSIYKSVIFLHTSNDQWNGMCGMFDIYSI